MKTLEIDGCFGEGGGQIVRTALSLSCVTGIPFRLFNIRKGRKRPGLMPQHITCVQAISDICSARSTGNEKGSQQLTFIPGKIKAGNYRFDIGTAGSAPLVFQTMLPPLLFAGSPSHVIIHGGTHVPFSPTYHYISEVFLPTLNRVGIHVESSIGKFGFYPKGGGEIDFIITPSPEIKALNIQTRGRLSAVHGYSAVSRLPKSIAERQKKSALQTLHQLSVTITVSEVLSIDEGTFIFLKSEYENSIAGFSSLGKRGKPAEEVGREAADELLRFHSTPESFDSHLADQLAIYLCLAGGNSSFTTARITQHLVTNLWAIQKFLPVSYQIEGEMNAPGKVTIEKN
jgi:RNA 3'-terminal phosphate cyclase (ATP)